MKLEFYPSNPDATLARVKPQKPPGVHLMTASRKVYLKNSIALRPNIFIGRIKIYFLPKKKRSSCINSQFKGQYKANELRELFYPETFDPKLACMITFFQLIH